MLILLGGCICFCGCCAGIVWLIVSIVLSFMSSVPLDTWSLRFNKYQFESGLSDMYVGKRGDGQL